MPFEDVYPLEENVVSSLNRKTKPGIIDTILRQR